MAFFGGYAVDFKTDCPHVQVGEVTYYKLFIRQNVSDIFMIKYNADFRYCKCLGSFIL